MRRATWSDAAHASACLRAQERAAQRRLAGADASARPRVYAQCTGLVRAQRARLAVTLLRVLLEGA